MWFWTVSNVEVENMRGPEDDGRPTGAWGVSEVTGWVYHPATPPSGSVPFYRFYDPINAFHFYTTDQNGEGLVANLGWRAEGAACYLPQAGHPGTVPLYRYRHPVTIEHYWSRIQQDNLNGFIFEGPVTGCGVFATTTPGTVPFFSLVNVWGARSVYHGNDCYTVRWPFGVDSQAVWRHAFNELNRLGAVPYFPGADCGSPVITLNYDFLNL